MHLQRHNSNPEKYPMANRSFYWSNAFFFWHRGTCMKRKENVEERPREKEIPLKYVHVQGEHIFNNIVVGEEKKKTRNKQKNDFELIFVMWFKISMLGKRHRVLPEEILVSSANASIKNGKNGKEDHASNTNDSNEYFKRAMFFLRHIGVYCYEVIIMTVLSSFDFVALYVLYLFGSSL